MFKNHMWFTKKNLSDEQLQAIEKELKDIRSTRLPMVQEYGRNTLDISVLIYWCDNCQKSTGALNVFQGWFDTDENGDKLRIPTLDEATHYIIESGLKKGKSECEVCKKNSKLISILFLAFDANTQKDMQLVYDAFQREIEKRFLMDEKGMVEELNV